MNWAEIAVAEVWGDLKQHDDRYRFTAFSHNNPHKVSALKQYAKELISSNKTQHISNATAPLSPPLFHFQAPKGLLDSFNLQQPKGCKHSHPILENLRIIIYYFYFTY